MIFTYIYKSPLGSILISSDETGLFEISFSGEKNYAKSIKGVDISEHKECADENENAVLADTKKWLDIYFSGKEPDFMPPFHFAGSDFQKEVWNILCDIPYGKTTTYGKIAGQIAKKRGIPKMSAQAVGGAVGSNPIGIIVPCHRVIGTDGSLTGFAGGLDKKRFLLELEGHIISHNICN